MKLQCKLFIYLALSNTDRDTATAKANYCGPGIYGIYAQRPDHNTGNYVPYSLRTVSGFFNVPQSYLQIRFVRRGLRFIVQAIQFHGKMRWSCSLETRHDFLTLAWILKQKGIAFKTNRWCHCAIYVVKTMRFKPHFSCL